MSTNPENAVNQQGIDFSGKVEEAWDKVEDKAEELWKQFQVKTGFDDEKIAELKAKASHKLEDLKAEMDTWDDEAKAKWEETQGQSR